MGNNDFSGNMFEDFIKCLSDKKLEEIKAPDDYIDPVTGLLMCGKCKTPKQSRIDGLDFIATVLCKCRREAVEAEEAAKAERERKERAEERRSACFRYSRVKRQTFDNDDSPDSDVSKACREYADNFVVRREAGRGLVLFGNVGTGKSFYAAAICNRVIDQGFSASFRNLSDIAPKLMSFNEEEQDDARYTLEHPDLIVFDDFGVERITDYMREGIQRAVNIRYETGKPMIFTTNYTANELKNQSELPEQRLLSRLYETCDFIRVSGADRRKAAYGERRSQ